VVPRQGSDGKALMARLLEVSLYQLTDECGSRDVSRVNGVHLHRDAFNAEPGVIYRCNLQEQ
jgi:hypothetical protein